MQEGDECDDEDFEDDMELMDEEEEDYDCYHEVHAIPLLDPVLDQQVRSPSAMRSVKLSTCVCTSWCCGAWPKHVMTCAHFHMPWPRR